MSCRAMLSSLGVPAALKAEGKLKAGLDPDSEPKTRVGHITERSCDGRLMPGSWDNS
jgi:hypothetical protein